MITWNERMSTGVEQIDVQHKHLIDHFNKLSEAIANGYGRAETGEMLSYLQFYTKWHFEREERCMDDYNCPVAAANFNAHQIFLMKIDRLYEAYQDCDTDPALVNQTLAELEDWIMRHIVKVDTQLQYCVPHYIEDEAEELTA